MEGTWHQNLPSEKHALAYAAKGFSVLPLWFPSKEGVCPCGTDCKNSRGKHPIGELAPNGVDSATRDVRTIAQWFQSDYRLNIGIACGPLPNGKTLIVFDVDSTEIAQALLRPEIGLADETAVAVSARGCHIYVYTDADVTTHTLYRVGVDHKQGKIGEIRSQGAYVVAPPSRHYKNVRYRWLGQSEEDESIPDIQLVADVDKYAAWLCMKAGFPVEPPHVLIPGGELPKDLGPITPIPVPFSFNALDNQRLWQFVSGTFPADGDRSRIIYHIAKELVSVAVKLGEVITGEQIAGVLKKLDQDTYKKYTGNARYKDPDREYVRIVWSPRGTGVLQHNGQDLPSTELLIKRAKAKANSVYFWDDDKALLMLAGEKKDSQLTNFKPTIDEELEIDSGDDVTRAYKITFSQPLGSVTLQVTPDDLVGEAAIRRKFYAECKSVFNVYPAGWPHLIAAMRDLSKTVQQRRVYRHTGWIDTPGSRAFILQGAGGAITEDSIDHDLVYDEDPKAHVNPKLQLYGVSVRPAVTHKDVERASSALLTLIRSAPPEIIIPIIAQVVTGPLASHGASVDPPLIHVMGKTGSMKTSLTTAALSIFGEFDRANVPETWMSTVNALQAVLYYCKDLTLLIDDYKTGTAGRVAGLIQMYSDRTTRSRMAGNQQMQRSLRPRGLLISTGEDMWDEQESTMARTIIVDMVKGDVNTEELTQLQEHYIPNGWLQLVGGAYLSWLIQFGSQELTDYYIDKRKTILKQLQENLGSSVHGRLMGALASLITGGRVFELFLKEVLPDVLDEYKALSKYAWIRRLAALVVQGDEAAEKSPFNQIIDTIKSSIQAKEVRIVHARDDAIVIGGPVSVPNVGYFDEEYLYLSEALTWNWFSQRRQRRGDNAVFSWTSFRKDAAASVQARATQLTPRMRLRFVRLSLTVLGAVGQGVDAIYADFINGSTHSNS